MVVFSAFFSPAVAETLKPDSTGAGFTGFAWSFVVAIPWVIRGSGFVFISNSLSVGVLVFRLEEPPYG